MTDRHSVGDLLRDLGSAPMPVEDEAVTSERRARLVSHVAREIRETSVRQSRRARGARVAAWLAVAAVVALLVGGLLHRKPEPTLASAGLGMVRAGTAGVVVLRAGHSTVAPVDADHGLGSGDAVSTVADARAALHLTSGADVSVAPSTRVVLAASAPGHERIELGIGEVSVHVPPLGANRSFSVDTPDALVTVHGTAFSVRVHKLGERTVTDVEVTEGKVSVRRGESEIFLLPGQSWSSEASAAKATQADSPPAPAGESELPAQTARPGAPLVTGSVSGSPGTTPKIASTDPSVLAEQNRLFAAAASARRRGDDRSALTSLNQLLTRFPDSPLAPEARVERFRTLKRMGDDQEAAREARRYLLEQRNGAAQDEARDVALGKK